MLYYSQYHNLLLIDRDGQLQQKIVLDSPSFGRRMVCRLVGALVAALFAGNGSDRAKHFANAAIVAIIAIAIVLTLITTISNDTSIFAFL